jgi:DNA-binding LacI/PurR family transcriptional regulator
LPRSSATSSRRITIRDVAKAAGVSLTTVSHALNDRGVVDPLTRAKVKQIAADMGYRPNVRAQRLRSGAANSIALVSSMPFAVSGGVSRLGFMMEVAGIAAEAAMRRGLALVFVPPLENAQAFLEGLDIDGAILLEPMTDDPNVRLLQERGVALVSIGRQGGVADSIPFIDLQSTATAHLLLNHLWEQGRRRIALVQSSAARDSYASHKKAYENFAAAHAMPVRYMQVEESLGEAGGFDACTRLLAQYPDTDALCVPVDAFAVGALAAVQQAGLRVPQDVMIATRYDGLRARTAEPALTAVDLHLEQVATLAVELLFEHLSGDKSRQSALGPKPELRARASTQLDD